MSPERATPTRRYLRDAGNLGAYRQMGGGRRSLQVEEILRGAGYEAFEPELPEVRQRWKGEAFLAGVRFLARQRDFPVRWGYQRIAKIGQAARREQMRYREKRTEVPVVLVERSENFIGIRTARSLGWRVIVLPHNIETLMYDQDYYTGKPFPFTIQREINHLRMADAVFAISREEQWLLNNAGVECGFLPYWPPAEDRAKLKGIQARRASTQPDGRVLFIGSGRHRIHRIALRDFLESAEALSPESRRRIVIAGFDLETFREQAEALCFPFAGELSPEELEEAYGTVSAILIYQKTGAGALTRIPEAFWAGIPVLGNGHGCRTFYNLAGLHCWSRLEELDQWLRGGKEFTPPEQASIDPDTCRAFIQRFEEVADADRTL